MEEKRFDLITFGEIMLRLSPPNYELMTRGDIFEKRAGGSDARTDRRKTRRLQLCYKRL